MRTPSASRSPRPFRKAISFSRPQHRVRVAEAVGRSACVGGVKDALFKAIHREADQGAGGDGVHAHVVAELMPLRYGGQAVDAAERAEGGQRLILGPSEFPVYFVRLFTGDHPLAAHRTGITGFPSFEDRIDHRLSVDLARALERPVREVPRRKNAGCVEAGHEPRRTELMPAYVGQVDLYPLIVPLGDGSHLGGPCEGHFLFASDGYGFQVLRAHEGPHSCPPVRVAQLVDNAREPHHDARLPGRWTQFLRARRPGP